MYPADCDSSRPWGVYFGFVGCGRKAVSLIAPPRPFLHTQDMYFVFVQLLSSGSAWFAIIIIVITCLFPDVVKKVLYRHLRPTSTQKSQVGHPAGPLYCHEAPLRRLLTGCQLRWNLTVRWIRWLKHCFCGTSSVQQSPTERLLASLKPSKCCMSLTLTIHHGLAPANLLT